MGAIAFLVTLAYAPLAGGFTSFRWIAICLIIPIWYFNPGRVTASHLLGLLFLAWCALSLTWAFDPGSGVIQLGRFVLLALVFCVAAAQQDLRAMWIGAGLGIAVNSLLALMQYFGGWQGIPQVALPGGTFFNKNILAETAAITFVGCLGLKDRWRWLALGALPAVILCQARGVWAGLTAALILLIWPKNKPAALALIGVCFLAICYFWGAGYTMTQRVQIWQDAFDGLQFWGRGVGSFWSTYPEHASRIDPLALRPENAHNDLLQLVYEIGPASLVICSILWLAFRARPLKAEHYALVVFLVAGLVGFPLYMPATAFLAVAALGHVAGAGAHLRISQHHVLVPPLHPERHAGAARGHARAASTGKRSVLAGALHASLGRCLLRFRAPVRRSRSRHWRHRGRAET